MEVDSKLKYTSEDLLSTLVSCLPYKPTNRILENDVMSAPYPSETELAHFSSIVYDMKYELLREFEIPDWQLLTTASNDAWSNGYFGAAFFSPSRQQVVLAHRGTSGVGAAWNDLRGVIFKNYSPQMSSAATFADEMKRAIDLANEQDGFRFHLSITGHSLGGWLAQVTGFSVKYLQAGDGGFTKNQQNGLHAHIVAFESPGCKHMLEEIIDAYDVRYRRTVSTEALDISNYFSAPNLINCFGLHVGSIYRVVIDVSDFTFADCKTEKYTIKTHCILNLAKSLKEKRKIHKMEDWPLSEISQKVLSHIGMKTEYKSFHDKVEHSNEFHLNFEHFTISDIRYKLTPDNFTSLGVFSENELKLLDFWVIFKREIVKTNRIQSFLTKHNLGEYKDLFVDFLIDMKNRVITCAGKEDMNMVVRRAKLLVRWFGAELMAAIDQQSWEIPKIMYSIINQKCLDSLPTNFIEFTDTIGLQTFLQSENRIFQIKTEDCDLEMLRLFSISCQLRESLLDMYVNNGCQTFLHWKDIAILHKAVDIEKLLGNDFTNNNLLVIGCGSQNILKPELPGIEQIFKILRQTTKKKIVLVTDEICDLSKMNVPVSVLVSSFECSKQTTDSMKYLFNMKMLDIGDITNLSIADFVGEQNFENFSSMIDKFIDLTDFKNILKSDKFVIKINNSCPNFTDCGANLSTINRKVDVESLVRIASSDDKLVVSGMHQEVLRKKLPRSNQGVGNNVIWMPGTRLDGEKRFKQVILEFPDKIVYWLETDSSAATTVKKIFHKSFYMRRRFHCRMKFEITKIAELRKNKDLFVFQGAPSKESLVRSLTLPKKESDEILRNEDILTADSNAYLNLIIYVSTFFLNRNDKISVHFMKFEENGERLLWQSSLGSLKNLRKHVYLDTRHAIVEEDLCALKEKVVIIADQPGMGKSSSLASMSQQLGTAWVIWVNLKNFKIQSDDVPKELRERCIYLLNYLIDRSIPRGLLELCLNHEHARQLYFFFDGFDEIRDNPAKKEVLNILKYLKNETEAMIWVTTRFNDMEMLENDLSTFAVKFEQIEDQKQRDYLQNFWYLHLLLKPTTEENEKLEKCAQALFDEAKKDLGSDIQSFMGVPLQIRMLAEVFLQRAEDCIRSRSELESAFQVGSLFSLYQNFIEIKYDIYSKDKTEFHAGTTPDLFKKNITNFTVSHSKLGLRALYHEFAELYCEDSPTDLGTAELCRIGLVQLSGNTMDVPEFIHRTLAEYFCAYQIHYFLSKFKGYRWYPTLELFLSQILQDDNSNVIRMFLNNFFKLNTTSPETQEKIAEKIEKIWSQISQTSSNNKLKQTALHVAAEENNIEIIKLLIGGLGKEKQCLIDFMEARDSLGRTALDTAAEHGHCAIVKYLVEKGGNIDTPHSDGRTILHIATEMGHLSVVKYLVEMGSNITRADVVVSTALLTAAEKGHHEIVLYLVDKGGKINSADKFGCTALHKAAQQGHLSVLKFLVDNNADINRKDKKGRTALHEAAEHGDLELVKFLVEKEVIIDLVDEDGRTALELAGMAKNSSVLQYLKRVK